jgi:succinyl-CoA synthetase beta subunit
MKIHEYQAKLLLREFGVPVPDGDVADTPAKAREIAQRLGGKVVVKAQVHAGGRGKGGGIKVVDGADAAETAAKQIIGMMLKTPQTPPEGILVRSVWVERASDIARELYLSMTLDRARATHVVMASEAGGMDIEEVAARTPDKIIREWPISRRAAWPLASASAASPSSRAWRSSATSSASTSPRTARSSR